MNDWLAGISSALDLTWLHLLLGLLIFLLTSAVSLFAVGFLLVRMPPGYFCDSAASDFRSGRRSGVHWWAIRVAKNLVGATLIVLGTIMALPGVPGPGFLAVLVGIMLTDFPGKRRLERWLISRPGVLVVINRLRHRFGKSPMFLESGLSAPLERMSHRD